MRFAIFSTVMLIGAAVLANLGKQAGIHSDANETDVEKPAQSLTGNTGQSSPHNSVAHANSLSASGFYERQAREEAIKTANADIRRRLHLKALYREHMSVPKNSSIEVLSEESDKLPEANSQ